MQYFSLATVSTQRALTAPKFWILFWDWIFGFHFWIGCPKIVVIVKSQGACVLKTAAAFLP